MAVTNASVYIDAENTTSYSDVDMSFSGSTLTSSSLRVWLPDDQFWDETSQVWLKLATAR